MDLDKIPRGTLVMVYYKEAPKDTPEIYRLHVFLGVAAPILDGNGRVLNRRITLFSYMQGNEEVRTYSQISKIVPFMFQLNCMVEDIETRIIYSLDRIYIQPKTVGRITRDGTVMLKMPGGTTIREKFTNLTKKYNLR